MSAQENATLLSEGEGGHEHDHEHDHELLEHEGIPDFAANPTHRITASGKWSEIVALQGVNENSVVVIEANTTVIYDRLDIRVKAIGVYGMLQFAMDKSTSLTVQELLVYGSGQLEIGTRSNPVPSNITVSITIGDKPLDIANDPTTAGNGIIVLGKIGVFGEQLQSTYASLAQSPQAGDRMLRLSSIPSGWSVGDTISLPQTMADASQPLSEEFRITAIVGDTLQLDRPVGFDRPAAMDGDLTTVARGFDGQELRGHVANLSRNVRFRSENPNGNRGHFMVLGYADVDIRYAAFESLGRTASGPLDSTKFDDAGNVTHFGTNQVGRYPLHIHHLKGPHNGIAPDPSVDPAGIASRQFRIVGNSIADGKKWGMAIHGSSYGLILGNVVQNVDGAGIVNEDGSEAFNYISKNFVFGLKGDGNTGRFDPLGTRGSAYWTRGGHNYWVGNIAAAAQEGFGLYITNDFGNTASGSTVVRIPKFPGADISIPGEYFEDAISNLELLDFSGNQVYSIVQFAVGTWVFSGANDPPPLFTNTTIWNSTGIGIYTDYGSSTVDGLILRGSARHPTDVVFQGHNAGVSIVRRFNIQQANKAFDADSRPSSFVLFEDGYVRNYGAFRIPSISQGTAPTQYVFRNVVFDAVAGKPLAAISTELDPVWIRGGGYVDSINRTIQVLVYGYQGNPDDNFRLYFNEQSVDYVIPVRAEGDMRSSESPAVFEVRGQRVEVIMPEIYVLGETLGQTGAQAWDTHRAAVLRELAPADAVSRNGFVGLVSPIPGGPIQSIPKPLPAPAFWFTSNSQSSHASTVDIVYKDFVAKGAEAILFSVDNGSWIPETDNDGKFRLTGLSPGIHRITAALAGATFAPWATRVAFDINVISAEDLVSFDQIASQSVSSGDPEQQISITTVQGGRIENGVRFSVLATNPSVSGQPTIDWISGQPEAKLRYLPGDAGQGQIVVMLTNAGSDKIFGTLDDISSSQTVDVDVARPPFDPNARVYFDPLPSTVTVLSDSGEQTLSITGIESGPGRISTIGLITSGDGLLSQSINYNHGDKSAALRFTPKPGFNGLTLMQIILRHPGEDGGYFTPDDLVHTQVITLRLSSSPEQPVSFDPLPTSLTIPAGSGEQTLKISGIQAGLGTLSAFELIPIGNGLQAVSIDYRHGDETATVRFTPQTGFSGVTTLELKLKNPGRDGLYNTVDDLVFKQSVILEFTEVVSFDPPPSTLAFPSDGGEQTFNITGIKAGNGNLSSIELKSIGSGILATSTSYQHGDKSTAIRFTPAPGFVGLSRLEIKLRNPGQDGLYDTADDLADLRTVLLELRPEANNTVSFDSLPSHLSISSDAGEQTINITGIRTGSSKLSFLGLITSGEGFIAASTSYVHGDKSTTIRLTPKPGFNGLTGLEISLRIPGPDGGYGSPDDVVYKHFIMFDLKSSGVQSSLRRSAANGLSSNRALSSDVNGDKVVSPMDALMVINALNSFGSGATGIENRPASADVNGDGRLSPIDALLIINTINSQRTAEGELSKNYSDSAMENKAVDLAITDHEVITSMKRKRFA